MTTVILAAQTQRVVCSFCYHGANIIAVTKQTKQSNRTLIMSKAPQIAENGFRRKLHFYTSFLRVATHAGVHHTLCTHTPLSADSRMDSPRNCWLILGPTRKGIRKYNKRYARALSDRLLSYRCKN